MKYLFAVAALLLSTMVVCAASIDGTWKGTMETPMGAMENTITLKADGVNLTGSVKTDFFESKIENATLKGDKVSFAITMDFGTLKYDGTLAGDDLNFNGNRPRWKPNRTESQETKVNKSRIMQSNDCRSADSHSFARIEGSGRSDVDFISEAGTVGPSHVINPPASYTRVYPSAFRCAAALRERPPLRQ